MVVRAFAFQGGGRRFEFIQPVGLAFPLRHRWRRLKSVLPRAKLDLQPLEGAEADPTGALLLIGPVTALDLPIAIGSGPRDVAVTVPQIVQVPREAGAKLAAMIRADGLNRYGETAPSPDLQDQGLDLR